VTRSPTGRTPSNSSGPTEITPVYDQIVRMELAGKNLACWCPPDGQPCHADVLLELANTSEPNPNSQPTTASSVHTGGTQ
jgi:hypothetical protein